MRQVLYLIFFSSISAHPANTRQDVAEESDHVGSEKAKLNSSDTLNPKPDRRNHDDRVKYDYNCHCGVSFQQPRKMTDTELHQFLSSGNHTKIVGGTAALPHEFPWVVSLEYYGNYYCGGSIISDRLVLTAAHCIKPNFPIYVRIGDHDKVNQSEAHTELLGAVAIKHPDFGVGKTLGSDIAVLRLDKRIVFSAFYGRVAPICLARRGDFLDTPVVAAGWGKTWEGGSMATVLQSVKLRTISNTQCFLETGYSAIQDYMDSTMLCARGEGKDTCDGDSGGPLMSYNMVRGRWELVGVVSWGVGCARSDYPGVYCRVVTSLNWILEYIIKFNAVMCREV